MVNAAQLRSTHTALDEPGTHPSHAVPVSSGADCEQTRWQNRIAGHADVDPKELTANPLNWRVHPRGQQQAMQGVLADAGWVDDVIVNRTTGNIVDGHLRVELAVARREPTVPVKYVELTEAEEREILATFDPLGAMARGDAQRLDALLRDLTPVDPALDTVIEGLARANGIDLLHTALTDPDQAPPPPAPRDTYVQPGDLWLGRVRQGGV